MLNYPEIDFTEDSLIESPLSAENRKLKEFISRLEHDLFFLYVFLAAQDDCEEACDFLHSHENYQAPFSTQF